MYNLDMSDTISISNARANLPDLVKKVSENYDRIIITSHGKPTAAVISVEELESLEETAQVLAIPGIVEDIRKSEEQIKKGEVVRLEDIDK